MVEMTMQMPDELATRIAPWENWLPVILELNLIGFKTVAAVAASEVITFLRSNPSPQTLLNYHLSDDAHQRLQRLLALNDAGLLSENEERELDELQQLEHVVIMLKARSAAN